MENINLSEVSLVDHPAHMVEGFAVIKSASPDTNRALLSALRKEEMPNEEKTLAEVLKDATAEQIREALTEEQLAELAPVEKAAETVEPTDDDIIKALPENVRALIEKAADRAAAAEADRDAAIAKAAAEETQRLDEAAIQKSKDEYTNLAFAHDTVAPALRKFASTNPEEHDAIVTMLKAVNEQADGAIFDEFGTARGDDKVEKSAHDRINDIAKARAAAEGITESAAYLAVVNDPAHAALVTEHFKENN